MCDYRKERCSDCKKPIGPRGVCEPCLVKFETETRDLTQGQKMMRLADQMLAEGTVTKEWHENQKKKYMEVA